MDHELWAQRKSQRYHLLSADAVIQLTSVQFSTGELTLSLLYCLRGVGRVFQGAENCLEGCVFVLTGVLESMEREDAKALIERYGGKVTGNISKKTTYMVQGRDSGASKLEKVKNVKSF